jgi:TonB family protein
MKDGDAVAATGWLDRAASLGVDGRSVARLRAEIESARLATVQEDRSRLLALANQRIAQGRLLDPPGDSARHYVDLLSAADPGYSGLAETATLLAAALLDDSGRLMRDGRYADAEAALAAAGSAGASKSEVASARSALNSARARAVASQEILPEGALTKIEHQPAKYPVRAASRGIEGWVDVQFTVAADGSTQDAVVTDSSPAGSFEQAVLDAVQGWRYQPRIVAGKPLDQRVQLRVRFELAGN